MAAAAAAVFVLAGATACAGGAGDGSITVAAASSLTEPMEVLADAFEAAHPGTEVVLTFDSSTTLATQAEAGAPIDVVAFADQVTMDGLAADGALVGPPTPIATNRLVVAVPAGNPAGVTALADVVDGEAAGTLALCAVSAPCGRLTTAAIDAAGLTLDETRVTRGQNVKATLGALSEGDADAAVVYASDVVAAGGAVDGVDLGGAEVRTTVTMAVLARSADPAVAEDLVAFVAGPDGRRALAEAGFGPP